MESTKQQTMAGRRSIYLKSTERVEADQLWIDNGRFTVLISYKQRGERIEVHSFQQFKDHRPWLQQAEQFVTVTAQTARPIIVGLNQSTLNLLTELKK